MQSKLMDNNISTGKAHLDIIILAISWAFIIAGKILIYMQLNIGYVSAFLGCIASLFVIVDKAQTIYDRRSKKRRK